MNIKILKSIFYLLSFLILYSSSFAQVNSKYSNPSKYDANFNGTGPKVYILPPPKTEVELLTERYENKKQNNAQIDSLLERLTFLKEIKEIPNRFTIQNSSKINEEEVFIEGIEYLKQQGNQNAMADWQNNLAVYYIKKERWEDAHPLLVSSLAIKNLVGAYNDEQIILHNLALLEIKNNNTLAAFALYDRFLSDAIKTKNVEQQIMAYLSLAKLEAKVGDFVLAHNLIIKKSMPLLQKRKDYINIVLALNDLASFKEMQERNTEAKWIYLQAIDVASKQQDEVGLALSYYNVARLKHKIGDENLAISDYNEAKKIAIKHKMKYLLIAINDKLGDAYLKLNDLETATALLNEYQNLKSSLIKQYF